MQNGVLARGVHPRMASRLSRLNRRAAGLLELRYKPTAEGVHPKARKVTTAAVDDLLGDSLARDPGRAVCSRPDDRGPVT
jgi:hypothetical protein